MGEIERSLAALGCLEQVRLRPGATEQAIRDLEEHIGSRLPDSARAFCAIQDGRAIVGGALLLPLEKIRLEWDLWRSIDEELMDADCAEFMESLPEGVIKPMYMNRAWVPFTTD